MKYLQFAALLIVAALVILSIVPAAERPDMGIQHDIEHFAAFMLPGVLFAAAFQIRTPSLLLAGAAFTLALECVQIPLPSRHARLQDFLVDTLAVWLGILIARVGRNYLLRFQT
jgi:VanZ family protein